MYFVIDLADTLGGTAPFLPTKLHRSSVTSQMHRKETKRKRLNNRHLHKNVAMAPIQPNTATTMKTEVLPLQVNIKFLKISKEEKQNAGHQWAITNTSSPEILRNSPNLNQNLLDIAQGIEGISKEI